MTKAVWAGVGALLLLSACGSDPSGGSVGGPSESVGVSQARRADVGTRLRVAGALVVSRDGAVLCDALAESSPPQCLNGVPLARFDRSVLPPDSPSVRGVTWTDAIKVIVERTRHGLVYVGGERT